MAGLKRKALIAAILAIAGCQQIDPAALRQQDELTCSEAGLTPDTDTFALCLMLQTNNRRMRDIETRLDFLDLEVRRAARFSRFPDYY